MKKTIICVLAVFFTLNLLAQKTYEKFRIGEPFPEFTLSNMKYFERNEINVASLKGRHTIIDIFNDGCVSCVKSWPHSKSMYDKFKKDLDIILLGVARNKKGMEKTQAMYDRFRNKLKLSFPVAFDTTVIKRFGFSEGPKLFWIDDKGVLKAITDAEALNPANIEDFLSGKEFLYFDKTPNKTGLTTAGTDEYKPFLIGNNRGIDSLFLYRSIIYKHDWNNYPLKITEPDIQIKESPGLFQFTNSLQALYKLAYFGRAYILERDGDEPQQFYGKVWDKPILNLKDSADFFAKNGLEYFYGYSLTYPKGNANTEFIRSSLQTDLKRQFGYEVKIQEQLRPYIKLVLLDDKYKKILKTKHENLGKDYDFVSGSKQADMKVHNLPISILIAFLNNWGTTNLPIIDMTDIAGNIDLDLKCIWTDIAEVRKALNKAGLDLVEDKKLMKVLVITEPESTNNDNKLQN